MKSFSRRRLLDLPPRLIFLKAAQRALSPFLRWRQKAAAGRYRNLFRQGRIPRAPGAPAELSETGLPGAVGSAAFAEALPPERRRLLSHYAGEASAHRFDLLGSGPVEVSYGTKAAGFVRWRLESPPGAAAERATLEMMGRLLGLGGAGAPEDEKKKILYERLQRYRPIDWQLDFRSGYRWDPLTWSRDIPIGRTEGADIKVPWELSRFQHLGAMGLALHLEETPQADFLSAEFVLQLTDWIVANPPCCGANWSCSMEVAIRAANWLWGLKLFARSPLLIPEFQRLVNWSLYHHAIFLRRNPENRDLFVGNHYLAGVAGQIYLETACPWLPQNRRWLNFAVREFSREIERQFQPDGTNFEGSTGYHRLTAEIFYAAALLLLHLDGGRRAQLAQRSRAGEPDFADPLIFPPRFWERALRAAEYIAALLKPDGTAPQLGDFDDGRFHKLIMTAAFDEAAGAYREEHHDFRPILAVAGTLFGREDFLAAAKLYRAEAELLTAAMDRDIIDQLQRRSPEEEALQRVMVEQAAGKRSLLAGQAAVHTVFSLEPFTGDGPFKKMEQERPAYFPDGGVAVFNVPPFHAVISCNSGAARGWGVHSHNDILSFELNVCGTDLVVDPGSYVYTASVAERNYFRATAAHNTLLLPGREQRQWLPGMEGLFSLPDGAEAAVLGVGPGYFSGIHKGYGNAHRRSFYLAGGAFIVEDHFAEKSFQLSFNLAPGVAVEEISSRRYILSKGNVHLYMEVISGGAAARGHVQSGYYSPSYGIKTAAARLIVELNSQEAD